MKAVGRFVAGGVGGGYASSEHERKVRAAQGIPLANIQVVGDGQAAQKKRTAALGSRV